MSVSTDLWRRVDEITARAWRLTDSERVGYLERACGGDAELRLAVDRLLDADQRAGSFLGRAAVPASGPGSSLGLPESAVEELQDRRRIGAYVLRRQIYAGSMSEVYLATRDDDEYRQQVAIKLSRSRIDSSETRHRLRAERQILARLQHPNIARLYDGGTTEDGQPYLIMEYIDGEPIDRWCSLHRLSIERRVDLMIEVCRAVQHAHQAWLVHRDLKPANVLVDRAGVVKLLDFGIAKTLGPTAEDGQWATRTGGRPMTPSYASPEQIRGEAITMATDVHGLGTLLYELLTGHRPFAPQSRLLHEIERAICEDPAQLPSKVVSEAGQAVNSANLAAEGRVLSRWLPGWFRRWQHKIRGDLDAIVLHALAKRPSDRYQTAAELADDLYCFQRNYPVSAARPGQAYQLRKFLARHRLAVAAGTFAALGVSTFVTALTLQAGQLQVERDVARRTNDFIAGIFHSVDPFDVVSGPLTATELVDQATREVDLLADEPRVQARLLTALGGAKIGLGHPEKAGHSLERAVEIYRQLGDLGDDYGDSLCHLARQRSYIGSQAEAEALAREALAVAAHLNPKGPAEVQALTVLGQALTHQGQTEEAEQVFRQALDILLAASFGSDKLIGSALLGLATVQATRQQFDASIATHQDALVRLRRSLGTAHPTVAGLESNLGVLLGWLGRLEEAYPYLEQAWQTHHEVLGEDHKLTLNSLNNLASNLLRQGDLQQTEEMFRSIVAAGSARRDSTQATSLHNLATLLLWQGRPADARPVIEESLAMRQGVLEPTATPIAMNHAQLAEAARLEGLPGVAESGFRRALDLLALRPDERDQQAFFPLIGLAKVQLAEQRLAAVLTSREAIRLGRQQLVTGDWQLLVAEGLLAAAEGNEDQFREAYQGLVARLGENDPRTREVEGWKRLVAD